jgi:hypothetical protein
MAKITTPVKGFNGIVAGVTFADGKGETHSVAAIAYFNRKGYTVESGKPVEKASVLPDGAPTDKWTKAELKAYAVAHDIDLGDAKKNEEILAKLTPAEVTDSDGKPIASGLDGAPVLTDPDSPTE